MTPQETDTELPVSVQKSLVEAWVGGGLLQGLRAVSVVVHAWVLLKEVTIIFIIMNICHHSLASGQATEREHSPAHQQKLD